MTGYRKVFLDTTPIIYFLDVDVNYAEKVEKLFSEFLETDSRMITSTITCTEYLTYPYRTSNFEKINAFYEFLSDCDIPICSISTDIAEKAAKIRAEYKDFKTMDCLQLATACVQDCDLFLTNDKQLRQFKEINCVTIDDL